MCNLKGRVRGLRTGNRRLSSPGRAERPGETAVRVASVRQYAAQTVRDGRVVQVFETDIPAPSWPSQWVDLIETKSIASMPDPRLPEAEESDTEQ